MIFVFDTDVSSLINILETRGKTKSNFFFILESRSERVSKIKKDAGSGDQTIAL